MRNTFASHCFDVAKNRNPQYLEIAKMNFEVFKKNPDDPYKDFVFARNWHGSGFNPDEPDLVMLTWGLSKAVYEFDGDLEKSLSDSDVSDLIPSERLADLPYWGIFVKLNNSVWCGKKINDRNRFRNR